MKSWESIGENVAAIGDSESDISMLKYAGIPVAMGNALEEVKKVCKVCD